MSAERSLVAIDGDQVLRRDEVEAHTNSLGDLPPDAFAALPAPPTLKVVKEMLALWSAGGSILPLHHRWDGASQGELLKRFAPVAGYEGWYRHEGVVEGQSLLLPTSGTASSPKIAVLPQRSIMDLVRVCGQDASSVADARWLLSLPLGHIGGCSILFRSFFGAMTLVLPPPGSLLVESWLACIHRHRVTHISFVPTQLAMFVDVGASPPPTVQKVLVGGAHASETLVGAARELGWPVFLTYGSTEGCSQLATEITPGGGLVPLEDVRLQIADDGEIEVESPRLFLGYLGGPQRNRAWYQTGDLGELDAEGRLRVVGEKGT